MYDKMAKDDGAWHRGDRAGRDTRVPDVAATPPDVPSQAGLPGGADPRDARALGPRADGDGGLHGGFPLVERDDGPVRPGASLQGRDGELGPAAHAQPRLRDRVLAVGPRRCVRLQAPARPARPREVGRRCR